MIDVILRDIENKKLGVVLRRDEHEIDIYSIDYVLLKRYLTGQGLVNIFKNKYKSKFSVFINQKLITFDIVIDVRYISDLYFNISSIKHADLNMYLDDPIERSRFDSLRYIFYFRKDRTEFFKSNFSFLKKNNFYFDSLDVNIFRKSFESYDDLAKFLEKDIVTVFKYIKFRFFCLHHLYIIFRFFKTIGKRLLLNNTYAVAGYDGSGKTTITDIISKELNTKNIYMGTKRFFNRFYYKYLDSHSISKLLRLLIVYFDFLVLYFKNYFYILKKEFVFYDRHPKMDVMPNSKIVDIALRCIFFFYPSPKKYFILYNEPNVILERKAEMTKKNILLLNNHITQELSKNKRVVLIKNNKIDDTLNIILSTIYNR